MFATLKNAWRIEELRKKIIFTLLIILIYRLGNAVPVPYVDTDLLQSYFTSVQNTVSDCGNHVRRIVLPRTIFALFYTALHQRLHHHPLLTIAIPAGRLQKEGGEEAREDRRHHPLQHRGHRLLQGFAYYMLSRTTYARRGRTGIWPAIVIIMTFMPARPLLCGWASRSRVRRGQRHFHYPVCEHRAPLSGSIITCSRTYKPRSAVVGAGPDAPGRAGADCADRHVNDAERRLPVQYSKRVVGRKLYGGQSTHLPMKVNMSGVLPIIFAQSIASLPATIGAFVEKSQVEGPAGITSSIL